MIHQYIGLTLDQSQVRAVAYVSAEHRTLKYLSYMYILL